MIRQIEGLFLSTSKREKKLNCYCIYSIKKEYSCLGKKRCNRRNEPCESMIERIQRINQSINLKSIFELQFFRMRQFFFRAQFRAKKKIQPPVRLHFLVVQQQNYYLIHSPFNTQTRHKYNITTNVKSGEKQKCVTAQNATSTVKSFFFDGAAWTHQKR